MGFIKAFSGAIGGSLADTWKDFIVPETAPATAGLFHGVRKEKNRGRGVNTKGSDSIITDGSKIVVPEGCALVTMQDGAVTGLITEPGGYTYTSDERASQSFFSGGSFADVLKGSWDRFKFGGIPASEQTVVYVNMKDIPDNRFGTQSEIQWDDAFLGTQAGAIARGSYTIRIVDPLVFVKSFVPQNYLRPDGPIFDFADMDNPAGSRLFDEVVSSLSSAFSIYVNDPNKANRITKIQSDQVGFAKSLAQAVEKDYDWQNLHGLKIVKAAIIAIEYDEDTKKLLSDVRRADALGGARGASFAQQAFARGMQAAGENGGAAGMAFMGMGIQAAGGMMGAFGQSQNASVAQTEDPYEKLRKMKQLLDDGVISQDDFDSAKKKLLGL